MILDTIVRKASQVQRIIGLPDATDSRTIDAAEELMARGICTPVLIGTGTHSSVRTLHPEEVVDRVAHEILVRRASKGITPEQARELALHPLYAAGTLLSLGSLHGVVAGSVSTTADVVRAALTTVGIAKDTRTVSSFFLMAWEHRSLIYTDCGIVPDPTAEQLVDIAHSASVNHKLLVGTEPVVAFLSFSTKGSAEHPHVEKVRAAAAEFASRYPHIRCDGELQADAALVPMVAERKAPASPVAGEANILVFPTLDAGNIAYKLTERLAGAKAIGPILQGLAQPYCDLSRGCSVEDIVSVAAITAVMAG